MNAARPRSAASAPRRVAIVGTSGVGKTTLARRLSRRLGLPHVELDALHWDAGWTPAGDDRLRERARMALRGDAWVVDGNYAAVRGIVWQGADTLVWLDYTLPVIMVQLFARTARRMVTRERLFNGNRESFRTHFFSRDSLFLWVLQTYWKRRREYPPLLQQPEHAHLRVVRLRSRQATERWLAGL